MEVKIAFWCIAKTTVYLRLTCVRKRGHFVVTAISRPNCHSVVFQSPAEEISPPASDSPTDTGVPSPAASGSSGAPSKTVASTNSPGAGARPATKKKRIR